MSAIKPGYEFRDGYVDPDNVSEEDPIIEFPYDRKPRSTTRHPNKMTELCLEDEVLRFASRVLAGNVFDESKSLDVLLSEARELMKKESWQRALALCEIAIQKTGPDRIVHEMIAQCMHRQGEHRKGMKYDQLVLAEDKYSVTSYAGLMEYYIAGKEYGKAVAVFNEAESRRAAWQSDRRFCYYSALAFYLRGDFDKTGNILAKMKLHEWKPSGRYEEGIKENSLRMNSELEFLFPRRIPLLKISPNYKPEERDGIDTDSSENKKTGVGDTSPEKDDKAAKARDLAWQGYMGEYSNNLEETKRCYTEALREDPENRLARIGLARMHRVKAFGLTSTKEYWDRMISGDLSDIRQRVGEDTWQRLRDEFRTADGGKEDND